ncbi:MAG: ATP-binding cassette domain-containing protein [Bacilli bacterium]
MLELKNVVKNYYVGDMVIEAVRGVSVKFRKNEFVAVLGPSGCGKTTLLNIIGGLDRYTSGDLIINGRSTTKYKDYDWDSYRNHSVGFVFQNYNLIPHQSVLKNVELALTLSGVSKAKRRKMATEALEKVGLGDQLHKKPNQLSGGQQQRVAIARALVNDPDILLADEPTGALDTKTSVPIMEILKEISKDRLIIMVTHNSQLAEKYASRLIRLLDGKIVSDDNPYEGTAEVLEEAKPKKAKKKEKQKTAMSFLTALALSLNNLVTKKTRTLLTAFAGSIGIIGIALVLALSNGFQGYINKMQADTLASYPIVITETSVDFTAFQNRPSRPELKKYPDGDVVYVNKIMERLNNLIIFNEITEEYIDEVIKTIDPSLYNGISYLNSVRLNVYKEKTFQDITFYQPVRTTSDNMMSGSIWQELIDNTDFVGSQYDVLAGRFPESHDELVIVVDQYNQITDMVLMALGMLDMTAPVDQYKFDEILGTKFHLIYNDALYSFTGTHFVTNNITKAIAEDDEKSLELEVVGIVRLNSETEIGSITGTVGYLSSLTDHVLEKSLNSEIVNWQIENENIDVFTGNPFTENPEEERYENLKKLGGVATPTTINIYPVDINAKEKIKEHLDAYNAAQTEEADKVIYTDLIEVVISSISTIINIISYVLIAFTAISLFVSSIMIGIITYISVLERTKEIGILRSIGARKKDISRVFNAETIIIGFTAGIMGIGITLLFTIPINIILHRLVEISNIAKLNPLHGVMMVVISMALTLIAGFIPARIAAKRDPVIALRTE